MWYFISYFSTTIHIQVAMTHGVLGELLSPVLALYEDVRRKALMRLEYEGLHRAEAISTPGARYHNNPAAFAMDRYAYYVCYKCNKVRQLNVLLCRLLYVSNFGSFVFW